MDEYIVVKALENGVNIIGLTSGKDTKFHHTEKLDKGEVFLAQFTDVDVYKRQDIKKHDVCTLLKIQTGFWHQ